MELIKKSRGKRGCTINSQSPYRFANNLRLRLNR